MKRRIKMGMTIAFICLAIGMLSFGVYATTTVSFSVSTSVSYIVTHLYLDINASVSGGSLTNPLTYSYDSVNAGGNPNDGTTLVWDKNTTSADGVTVSSAGAIGNLSFAATDAGKTITFTFEFENNGAKTVSGSISENTYPTSKVTQSIDYGTGDAISIASKGKQTVTVTYTLKSFGFSLSDETISLQFSFSD